MKVSISRDGRKVLPSTAYRVSLGFKTNHGAEGLSLIKWLVLKQTFPSPPKGSHGGAVTLPTLIQGSLPLLSLRLPGSGGLRC